MIWIVIGVVVLAAIVFFVVNSGSGSQLGAGQRVGTRGWEAALTLDPLTKTIAARKIEFGAETDEKRRDRLTREIAFLEKQVPELEALVAARDASPGLGFIGFIGFKQLPPD